MQFVDEFSEIPPDLEGVFFWSGLNHTSLTTTGLYQVYYSSMNIQADLLVNKANAKCGKLSLNSLQPCSGVIQGSCETAL